MKGWQQLPDDEHFTNKQAFTFPDNRTFIVAYDKVLFGYRVVGYWKHDEGFLHTLNWCCGMDIGWIAKPHTNDDDCQ
jgi:hypothetical protein